MWAPALGSSSGQLLPGIMHTAFFDPVLQPIYGLFMQQLPQCEHLPWLLTLARPAAALMGLGLQQLCAGHHWLALRSSKLSTLSRQRAGRPQYVYCPAPCRRKMAEEKGRPISNKPGKGNPAANGAGTGKAAPVAAAAPAASQSWAKIPKTGAKHKKGKGKKLEADQLGFAASGFSALADRE